MHVIMYLQHVSHPRHLRFHSENRNRNHKIEIAEQCKGVHCVDLDERFQTHIYLQNLASIQPRTSPLKFAASVPSPRTPAPAPPLLGSDGPTHIGAEETILGSSQNDDDKVPFSFGITGAGRAIFRAHRSIFWISWTRRSSMKRLSRCNASRPADQTLLSKTWLNLNWLEFSLTF